MADHLIASGLAVLLLVAGTVKILRPEFAAGALYRALGPKVARAPVSLSTPARLLGSAELAVGASLVGAPARFSVASAGASAVTFVTFVGFTALARRRGVACGCWGSLSSGPAGEHELVRRCGLAVAAGALVAMRAGGHGAPVLWPLAAVVVGTGLVAGVALSRAERLGPWGRAVGAAAIEVWSAPSRRRPTVAVGRRDRRRLLAAVKIDGYVRRVCEAVGPDRPFDWGRARVLSSVVGGDAPALVSVPGRGASLRIVVERGAVSSVIGETDAQLVVVRSGAATGEPVILPKPRRGADV